MKAVSFVYPLPDGRMQSATWYRFDSLDEIGLPIHQHDFTHSCLVIHGEAEVYDDAGASMILKEGECTAFEKKQKHGIRPHVVPLEIVNIPEPGGPGHAAGE